MSVSPERISVVLNRDHERFFSPLLANVTKRNLIVQSRNRGTAPAILYSLLHLAQWAPQASVLLIPSDHHVEHEAELMNYVNLAFAAVEERPGLAVLLGITPDEAETAYGWIEPGSALSTGGQRNLSQVRRFWEKPSREIARELMAKGCLWNSFMIVGQLPALLGLFIVAMPELYISFSRSGPVWELSSKMRSSAGYTSLFRHPTSRVKYWSQRPAI
jgi:mannose-1-phosphate guanylyltransferase